MVGASLLGLVFVHCSGQQDSVRDGAALNVCKAGVRVTAQVEMGIECRSTPHRVWLRPETRHCCHSQGSFEEGSPLHGFLPESIFTLRCEGNNCPG